MENNVRRMQQSIHSVQDISGNLSSKRLNSNTSWKRQRLLKRQPIPMIDDVIYMISGIESDRNRCLAALCYLTAGRISEIVRQDTLLKIKYKRLKIVTKEGYHLKGDVMKDSNNKPIVANKEIIQIDYAGIRKKDISFRVRQNINGRVFSMMYIRMQNRKNKTLKYKYIPIPICEYKDDKVIPNEVKLYKFVEAYMNKLEGEDTPLFNFKRFWAAKIIANELGMNPHFFRDIRLTHLVTEYGFNDQQLVKYAGWTDSRPAKHYVAMRTSDILPIRK